MQPRDEVSKQFGSGGWEFTEEVAAVFDEHVAVNVPQYELIQNAVAFLSDWLAPDHGVVADVGASTGTTVDAIRTRHAGRNLTFHLYDTEYPMLAQARTKLGDGPLLHHVDAAEDVRHVDADLTLLLFTLQFVPTHRRPGLIRSLASAARPGTGHLLVAEKVYQPTPFWQEVANEATWDYKAEHGVDAEIIRSKARALRGVLNPLPVAELESLLTENGWADPVPIYRWHQWGLWAVRIAPEPAGRT